MKLSLKDSDGAIADFDAALKLEPEDASTYEAKGLTLPGGKMGQRRVGASTGP